MGQPDRQYPCPVTWFFRNVESVNGGGSVSAETIIHNAKIATNDVPSFVEAVAIGNGKIIGAGKNDEILRLREAATKVIDAKGRTIIPGLNDSHMHPIRGGLNYNMELRWDGVPSIADALRMLKEQAARTPAPQWVRVIGGWTEFVPRPDMFPVMENELRAVIRHLVENRWPFRLHATYNETIERALNVYEEVHREIPFDGLHWFFDHCETISDHNIERVKALGGGIAIQNRMAFQGEYFVERYGAQQAKRTPPIRRMLEMGVPIGAG